MVNHNRIKFSAGIWVFGGAVDRFCTKGYGELLSPVEAINKGGQVEDLEGLELYYPTSVNEDNLTSIKEALERNDLKASSISLDIFSSAEWKNGAFINGNQKQREKAVRLGKEAIDIAKELNCDSLGIWPGQDGFDYPFQADYQKLWDREIQGIKEIVNYDPQIQVAVEYKLKEPRRHMLIGSVGKALLVVQEIDEDNLGVVLDYGHALMSKENPAESAALLAERDKLFNVHINDAYREWDDDMAVGTINLWETVEFLHNLQQIGYEGFLELDQFPFRQDPVEAADLSIRNLKSGLELAQRIDHQELKEAQADMDITRTQNLIREAFFT